MSPYHQFDNGIKVYAHHLLDLQRERYATTNLHEPVEEQWFLTLLADLPPMGVFVDVGAAVGYYSILAKRTLPELEIHAFEPLDTHREYLRENLALNDLPLSAVTLHSEAVSAQRGKAQFRVNHYGSALTDKPRRTLRAMIRRVLRPTQDSIKTVMTTTLDSFAVVLGKSLDLVKVDVQGAELDVLHGAQHSEVGAWIIGTHSADLHAACRSWLTVRGYHILFDDPAPPAQPDGILAARRAESR